MAVAHNPVQQIGPLFEPGLQSSPLLGVNNVRQQVKLPWSLGPRPLVKDVEGHAVLGDEQIRLRRSMDEFGQRDALSGVNQWLPGRTGIARRVECLVVNRGRSRDRYG